MSPSIYLYSFQLIQEDKEKGNEWAKGIKIIWSFICTSIDHFQNETGLHITLDHVLFQSKHHMEFDLRNYYVHLFFLTTDRPCFHTKDYHTGCYHGINELCSCCS